MIRRSRRLLLSAVAGLAVAATTALVVAMRADAADDKKAAVPAKPALSVVVTQPQRATMAVSTSANGNIALWHLDNARIFQAESLSLRLDPSFRIAGPR